MKFVCILEDEDTGETIPGGCGEVDCIHQDLYSYINRAGEDLNVSIRKDGTAFFNDEQESFIPYYWDKSKLIEIVEKKSKAYGNLEVGKCPKCGGEVYVLYLEEEEF